VAKRITLDHVNAYYGGFHAIDDLSMVIEERSITAFIGPSGCGKSTALRTINRMHEVIPGARVEGRIALDDEDIYAAGIDPVDVRRKVGMVFQRPNPFPTMSIYENVVAGMKLNGGCPRRSRTTSSSSPCAAPTSGTRSRTAWTARRRPVRRAAAAPVHRAAIAVARGPAHGRAVLALDPISTLAIEDLMEELKKDYTIVIVTHNMQQAARVSDRTAFFSIQATGEPGRLVELDDTQKIFSNPGEKRTEDYITGRFG
jgi:phosphate transport system ATP-binding protein